MEIAFQVRACPGIKGFTIDPYILTKQCYIL